MEREIYQKMLIWKEDPHRKPLIVYGARQVGKSYIVKEFGDREFDNLIILTVTKMNGFRVFLNMDFGRKNCSRILKLSVDRL